MKQLFLSLLVWILKWAAQTYLSKTKPYIIGITGSVGKTSCRLIISDTLKKLLSQELIYTSPKNYNSDIGLSLSILGIEDYKPNLDGVLNALFEGIKEALFPSRKPSILLLEYGIDKPGDMDLLLSIVVPDIAILTAIDSVHAANFPDGQQGIFNEKIKLLKAAKDIVFYEAGALASVDVGVGKTQVLFGAGGQIGFESYAVTVSGDRVTSSYIYKTNADTQSVLTITTNISGTHNISYQCIGITIADIISHRKKYPSLWTMQALQIPVSLQPGRFTLFLSTRGDIIVDSTYNASPSSMRAVISDALELQQGFFSDYKIMLVLGEMRELGDISKQEHQELGNWLKDKANYVVGVSGDSVYMTDYLIGLQNPALQVNRLETNIAAYEYIKDILNTHPEQKFFIVFKSSQGEIRLEEAIKPFILPAQWNNLPRQEQYWLSKKTFMKKIYIAEGEAK